MHPHRQVDVVIIGGGPAGLSAAIVMARSGLRTVVCEQQAFPVDKACGEGIMPTGVAYLQRLGVARHLPAQAVQPFAGIRYHSIHGCSAAACFIEGPGWGVKRQALSAALLHTAREFDNVEIRSARRAESIAQTAGGIVVQVDGERVLTRLLIGADGLNSRVRRWAGLDGQPSTLKRWGARQHFDIAPWSQYVEVYLGNGLEAYITPCSAEQVGVAFLWDRSRHHRVRGGQGLIASLMQSFPEVQARLAGVRPTDVPRAAGPLQRNVKSVVADGVLLIGDAAGYLDAITGEGLSLAMAQALCLEQTVIPVLQRTSGPPTARELTAYAKAHRVSVRPYYQMTQLVLWLSRHATLAERVIQVLHRQPAIFQHLLSASMGLASPWSPRMMSRWLGRMLRPGYR